MKRTKNFWQYGLALFAVFQMVAIGCGDQNRNRNKNRNTPTAQQQQLTAAQATIQSLRKARSEAERLLEEERTAREKLDMNEPARQKEIQDLKRDRDQARTAFYKAREELRNNGNSEELKRELEEKKIELARVQGQLNSLVETLGGPELVQRAKDSWEDFRRVIEERLSGLEQNREAPVIQTEGLRTDIQSLTSTIQALQDRIGTLENGQADLLRVVSDSNQKIIEIHAQRAEDAGLRQRMRELSRAAGAAARQRVQGRTTVVGPTEKITDKVINREIDDLEKRLNDKIAALETYIKENLLKREDLQALKDSLKDGQVPQSSPAGAALQSRIQSQLKGNRNGNGTSSPPVVVEGRDRPAQSVVTNPTKIEDCRKAGERFVTEPNGDGQKITCEPCPSDKPKLHERDNTCVKADGDGSAPRAGTVRDQLIEREGPPGRRDQRRRRSREREQNNEKTPDQCFDDGRTFIEGSSEEKGNCSEEKCPHGVNREDNECKPEQPAAVEPQPAAGATDLSGITGERDDALAKVAELDEEVKSLKNELKQLRSQQEYAIYVVKMVLEKLDIPKEKREEVANNIRAFKGEVSGQDDPKLAAALNNLGILQDGGSVSEAIAKLRQKEARAIINDDSKMAELREKPDEQWPLFIRVYGNSKEDEHFANLKRYFFKANGKAVDESEINVSAAANGIKIISANLGMDGEAPRVVTPASEDLEDAVTDGKIGSIAADFLVIASYNQLEAIRGDIEPRKNKVAETMGTGFFVRATALDKISTTPVLIISKLNAEKDEVVHLHDPNDDSIGVEIETVNGAGHFDNLNSQALANMGCDSLNQSCLEKFAGKPEEVSVENSGNHMNRLICKSVRASITYKFLSSKGFVAYKDYKDWPVVDENVKLEGFTPSDNAIVGLKLATFPYVLVDASNGGAGGAAIENDVLLKADPNAKNIIRLDGGAVLYPLPFVYSNRSELKVGKNSKDSDVEKVYGDVTYSNFITGGGDDQRIRGAKEASVVMGAVENLIVPMVSSESPWNCGKYLSDFVTSLNTAYAEQITDDDYNNNFKDWFKGKFKTVDDEKEIESHFDGDGWKGYLPKTDGTVSSPSAVQPVTPARPTNEAAERSRRANRRSEARPDTTTSTESALDFVWEYGMGAGPNAITDTAAKAKLDELIKRDGEEVTLSRATQCNNEIKRKFNLELGECGSCLSGLVDDPDGQPGPDRKCVKKDADATVGGLVESQQGTVDLGALTAQRNPRPPGFVPSVDKCAEHNQEYDEETNKCKLCPGGFDKDTKQCKASDEPILDS